MVGATEDRARSGRNRSGRDRSGKGSLTVVGTGFCAAGQSTLEAVAHLEAADKVFFVVADPVSEMWIESVNPTAESLADAYAEGKPRSDTYREMVERILAPVRRPWSPGVHRLLWPSRGLRRALPRRHPARSA